MNYYSLYGKAYQMLAEHAFVPDFSEKYNTIDYNLLDKALRYASDSLDIYTIEAKIASRRKDYEHAKALIMRAAGHLEKQDDRAASLYTMYSKIKFMEGDRAEALRYLRRHPPGQFKKTYNQHASARLTKNR
jgi:hypothetical protein